MGGKLVLHVGTHKTGTSAIQAFMHANAKALKTRGFDYPHMPAKWPGILRNRNGFFLNRAARMAVLNDTEYKHAGLIDKCIPTFEKSLASGLTTVLSDERLWYTAAAYEGYWRCLRDIAVEHGASEFEVVVYLRPQDQLAEGLWNQYVKNNVRCTQGVSEFLQRQDLQRMCDYDHCLSELEETFGHESVTVRIFDRQLFKDGDVTADFLDLLGMSLGDDFVPLEAESNPSLNGNIAELKRVVNAQASYAEVDNYLQEPAKAATLASTSASSGILGPQERSSFTEGFANGNAAVAQRFFEREVLFLHARREIAGWENTFSPAQRDMFAFLAEALTAEHARNKQLEEQLKELKARVEKLEAPKQAPEPKEAPAKRSWFKR